MLGGKPCPWHCWDSAENNFHHSQQMHSRSSESGVLKSVIAGTTQNTAQLAKSVYHSN